MNLSQLRRAVWLRRLSAASQSRFTLLKNHYRLGWLSAKTLFERRDALAAKMTPTQIAEAQKLAREWSRVSNSSSLESHLALLKAHMLGVSLDTRA
jgi:hypothetical protein